MNERGEEKGQTKANTSLVLWSVLGSAIIFKLCICVYVGHAREK